MTTQKKLCISALQIIETNCANKILYQVLDNNKNEYLTHAKGQSTMVIMVTSSPFI
uniref:Uncharacterized protein n=1 Tax=Arion vulgaris TaxID=1028688 RepID=A0A0B6Z0R9_9EUPU